MNYISTNPDKVIVLNNDYMTAIHKFSGNAKAGDIVDGVGVVFGDVDFESSPNGIVVVQGLIDMTKLEATQYPSEAQANAMHQIKWVESDGTIFAGSVNRANLQAAIADAKRKIETDYTPATWTPFKAALDEAERVNGDSSAQQAQVDTAEKNLKAKQAALQNRANFATLNATIQTADTKQEAEYTPETWAPFKSSLDAAKVVAANLNATQGQVDNANSDLNTKMTSLAPKA